LEELAALIDGRLPTAEAARVRAHLASCEDCYEVFAETLHLQEELRDQPVEKEVPGKERKTRRVLPFPSKEDLKPHLWWAAAALLVTVLGFGLYQRPPDRSVASLAARTGKVVQVGNMAWGERTRGAGSHEGDPSFRLGVELLNLQVALESKDGNTADAAAATVYGLLEPIAFMDEKSKEFYRKLRVRIPNQTPESLSTETAKEADVLHGSNSLDEFDFELGTWAEAGRFAAYSRHAAFFDPKSARYFMRKLPKEEDPNVTAALKVINARLAVRQLGLGDYAALKSAFDQILKAHYPEGERSGP
jgi:hypothetical protein